MLYVIYNKCVRVRVRLKRYIKTMHYYYIFCNKIDFFFVMIVIELVSLKSGKEIGTITSVIKPVQTHSTDDYHVYKSIINNTLYFYLHFWSVFFLHV